MGATPSPGLDALLPPAIAEKAAGIGADKARMVPLSMFALAVLAGAFIALGAMFATVVTAGSGELAFGIARVAGGLAFCLGLILVVVAGAELFTGDNLMVMARAERRIGTRVLLRAWAIVYAGNLVGGVATAVLVFAARQYTAGDGQVGLNALKIAEAKSSLGFGQAIALGVLCNALVCLAVWLTYGARSVADKILAIIFPITAFVAAGFEHSVANMYFIPEAIAIRTLAPDGFWRSIGRVPADFPSLTPAGFLSNLLPVTIGNVIGGALMVGIVYWFIYLRTSRSASS